MKKLFVTMIAVAFVAVALSLLAGCERDNIFSIAPCPNDGGAVADGGVVTAPDGGTIVAPDGGMDATMVSFCYPTARLREVGVANTPEGMFGQFTLGIGLGGETRDLVGTVLPDNATICFVANPSDSPTQAWVDLTTQRRGGVDGGTQLPPDAWIAGRAMPSGCTATGRRTGCRVDTFVQGWGWRLTLQ